tara:strand:- start:161 stop:526 length:366 start_codon:yes stop_codon:yes gene_type:complete
MIATHLGLILLTVLVFEAFLFFNIKKNTKDILSIFTKLFELTKRIKNISDYTFERALIIYSKFLINRSLKFFLFCVVFLFLFLGIYKINRTFALFLISYSSIIKITIVLIIYNFLRKRIYE